jgi:hypothetical protein
VSEDAEYDALFSAYKCFLNSIIYALEKEYTLAINAVWDADLRAYFMLFTQHTGCEVDAEYSA